MKLDENKHDHKLTNWLKVGIFALLMIAPLFASISQTLYVTFNKNAYESYNYTESLKLQKINSINSVINNETYTINLLNNGVASPIFYTNDANDILVNQFGFSGNYQYKGFRFDTRYENKYIYAYSDINTTIVENKHYSNVDLINNNLPITFKLIQLSSDLYQGTNNYSIYLNVITKGNTLDNAFYYGVEKMTESDLFNWTQNTALYTGINAMTTQLEIQTPAIAILLTYWFILTIIYVIIDIVLKGFTLLTHMFSNKV